MFLKISIKFSIYTKGGANFQKLEMVRCFISNFNSFLNFLYILENFLGKIKKPLKNNKNIASHEPQYVGWESPL